MALKHVFFILALTCLIMENIANATSWNDRLNNNMKPDYDLTTRLEVSEGLTECWNVFTVEEGNILSDYYDASSAPSPGGLTMIYQP
ncbi:hypothetical protein WN943_006801 [Citrus x changshan-huyou]